jgi:hypothetical protein
MDKCEAVNTSNILFYIFLRHFLDMDKKYDVFKQKGGCLNDIIC